MSLISDEWSGDAPVQDDVVAHDDPRVALMRVGECGEPLLDARQSDGLVVDTRVASAALSARLRAGTLDRMVQAQHLLPAGWSLALVEGYRPPPLQQRYVDDYCAHLCRRYPDWDAERRLRRLRRAVPPPEVAPHVTGGAVDVTLLTASGALAWMGTEISAFPEDCDGACATHATNISTEAARHRMLLYGVMSRCGFVNDPAKWWHWSFGDRYWAVRTGATTARYGAVTEINTR